MEKAQFKLKVTKQSRYDSVKEIADRLGDRVGKWLKKFEGWKWEDIEKLNRAAESMMTDAKKPYGYCLNWMYEEINKGS